MASFIVVLDVVWYSTLAFLVTRARRAISGDRWTRRLERLSGAVMVGLGLRLALESR
jgi:threonine/homoserine/homoserine lactone efflux protein